MPQCTAAKAFPCNTTQRNAADRRGASRRGLTLVEMLLALSITAMIGVAVTSMLFSMAHGTASNRDMRGLTVRGKSISARLSATIRNSHLVLAQDSDLLVLWKQDTNENDQPDLSEIQWLQRDPTTGRISSFTWTDGATDAAYELSDDFVTALTNEQDNLTQEVWAQGVTLWEITIDGTSVQSTDLVSYRVTLQAGQMLDVTVNAAALRNRS